MGWICCCCCCWTTGGAISSAKRVQMRAISIRVARLCIATVAASAKHSRARRRYSCARLVTKPLPAARNTVWRNVRRRHAFLCAVYDILRTTSKPPSRPGPFLCCPWRIRKSSHKRRGPGSLVRYRRGATVRIDDSPAHSRRPPVGYHRKTRLPGRSVRRRGRILGAKAPVAHQ